MGVFNVGKSGFAGAVVFEEGEVGRIRSNGSIVEEDGDFGAGLGVSGGFVAPVPVEGNFDHKSSSVLGVLDGSDVDGLTVVEFPAGSGDVIGDGVAPFWLDGSGLTFVVEPSSGKFAAG